MDNLLATLYVLFAAIVAGMGRRVSGSAEFERVVGRGAFTARLVCLTLPLGLLSWVCLPGPWALLFALCVHAAASLPQRGQALVHWYDPFYLAARGVGVSLVSMAPVALFVVVGIPTLDSWTVMVIAMFVSVVMSLFWPLLYIMPWAHGVRNYTEVAEFFTYLLTYIPVFSLVAVVGIHLTRAPL